MTQSDLAGRLGVDQSTVSGWERDDKRRPGRDLMPAVAKALGRTPEWLENREGGLSDRDRDWDDPAPRATATDVEPAAAPVDEALLADVIRMAMRNLLTAYGVDIPERRFAAAADAAASAYQSYFQLRRSR